MTTQCPKCKEENTDAARFCSNCATPLLFSEEPVPTQTIEAPKEELTTGSTFADRYQIIEELGKGGMGKVYKVLDKEVKAKIALKLIKPEIAADKKTIERFRNELKTARDISHKNICRMYDLNKEEGSFYITMEYVSGEDLKSFIRRSKQLAIGTAISIANQICEGLEEAHRLGVVHRDLKPSNIMIDKDGNARIMDFGIARSLETKGITGAGVMIGTPEYMSPEQVEAKDVDQRSDIYSLGIILYEMTTGRLPFQADTPFAVGVMHKSETPKDPTEHNAQISEDLNHVILRCLEKDKDNRYQSATELLTELRSIEKGIPSTEKEIAKRKPITSKEVTVQFTLRKATFPLIGAVALIIIALVIWRPWSKEQALPVQTDKPSLAVMYFENNTGDENLDHWRKGISDLLITDLTQSKYLKVLGGDKLFDILSQMNLLEATSYSSEALKEVATKGGVKNILRGSYSKAGDTIRIDITLQDANTGEPIATDRIEGKDEESIFPMVDELTKRVKSHLELSPKQITDDIDNAVGELTTDSPEAYSYFIKAARYWIAYENRKAVVNFEKAIELDPEFALAYVGLSSVHENLGETEKRKKYAEKAFELREKVSEIERYRIEAEFYRLDEDTYGEAIEAFGKLKELNPERYRSISDLAYIYTLLEEWDKAINELEWVVQNKIKKSPYSYWHLTDAFQAKGLYEKAKEVSEIYLNDISDEMTFHEDLSLNYVYQGEYDQSLVEIDKAIFLDPNNPWLSMRKGIIFHLKGDFQKAKEQYKSIPEAEPESAIHLSCLEISKGKIQNQHGYFGYLDRMPNYAYLYLGKHYEPLKEGIRLIERNSIDEALIIADELKKSVEKEIYKKRIKYYHYLVAIVALKRENFDKAREHLEKAISLLPFQMESLNVHAFFMEPLAYSYYKIGDMDRSKKTYKDITNLTIGRLYWGDIYAKSFYMLGKICEEQGDTAKAIEHYEKFLNLWKDADPGIPEVEDARERLAGLKR
jgi:serine/threonine protein kinase/tetratricopeptide (TPR) repeat protein